MLKTAKAFISEKEKMLFKRIESRFKTIKGLAAVIAFIIGILLALYGVSSYLEYDNKFILNLAIVFFLYFFLIVIVEIVLQIIRKVRTELQIFRFLFRAIIFVLPYLLFMVLCLKPVNQYIIYDDDTEITKNNILENDVLLCFLKFGFDTESEQKDEEAIVQAIVTRTGVRNNFLIKVGKRKKHLNNLRLIYVKDSVLTPDEPQEIQREERINIKNKLEKIIKNIYKYGKKRIKREPDHGPDIIFFGRLGADEKNPDTAFVHLWVYQKNHQINTILNGDPDNYLFPVPPILNDNSDRTLGTLTSNFQIKTSDLSRYVAFFSSFQNLGNMNIDQAKSFVADITVNYHKAIILGGLLYNSALKSEIFSDSIIYKIENAINEYTTGKELNKKNDGSYGKFGKAFVPDFMMGKCKAYLHDKARESPNLQINKTAYSYEAISYFYLAIKLLQSDNFAQKYDGFEAFEDLFRQINTYLGYQDQNNDDQRKEVLKIFEDCKNIFYKKESDFLNSDLHEQKVPSIKNIINEINSYSLKQKN